VRASGKGGAEVSTPAKRQGSRGACLEAWSLEDRKSGPHVHGVEHSGTCQIRQWTNCSTNYGQRSMPAGLTYCSELAR